MPESTNPATPYEVLGVSADASTEDLRRAYRRRLRETHPDIGGQAAQFHAVQLAWERVGTPQSRAIFDRVPAEAPGRAAASGSSFVPHTARPQPWDEPAAARHAEPVATARSHGHPGGWNREEYFVLMREWVGRGAKLDNPYDNAMVRSAPREIGHLLADAIAEEETARTLSHLGIAYTIWHDVRSDVAGPGSEQKIDHIVLGPTGLFALLSEDWGGALQVRKGELVSDRLALGERPMSSLSKRTRSLARSTRVHFTALVIVVPDGTTAESLAVIGRERGVPSVIVQKSRLGELMEVGLPGTQRLGADEIFAARDRLNQMIEFI
jgi:curved DNA-binding protein CbpA